MLTQLAPNVLSWASIIDDTTREQALALAALPFITPHVALMPDAHAGKGSAVGTVIPTDGAVIPAAVGVDIGCFVGETRVSLVDGRQKTLKQMTEEGGIHWVYSRDNNLQTVAGRATAFKTRTNAPLMSVTISGGEDIICTPDHEFMLTDGTYREAQHLTCDDSLMSLDHRRQTRHGQQRAHTGTPETQPTRTLASTPAATVTTIPHTDAEHAHHRTVIKTEHLDRREDVYCLQVEDHNNFALAAGVFVHNCGMIAAHTRYTADDLDTIDLIELRDQIERSIPLSPGNYNRKIHHDHTQRRITELEAQAKTDGVDLSHSPQWRVQLGSLGGGNHFIELCLDEQDRVWCFLHSGSRGVGNKIAQKHIKIARGLMKKQNITLADQDHAYLTEDTPEFDQYLTELRWAQRFALLNREEMMDRFVSQLARLMGDAPHDVEVRRVNTHHNYTEKIPLHGTDLWLTRKGAIDARDGVMGLIPGSMGTRSYVTRGKGNADALYSAPHGAGRVMSRRQAKKHFTAADLDHAMKGIVYRPGAQWVDEIPAAYKNIDQVMADAANLVEIVHELRQVLNVKGT